MIPRVLNRLRHKVTIVRSAATKRVIQQFADYFGLVYFGHVDQHSGDHALVRGVTVSAAHKDRHYCVGSVQGYDVTLVQRTDTLHFPGKPTQHYTWLILQIDLHVPEKTLSHMLLDAHHHGETFYANLQAKYSRLRALDHAFFAGHDSAFINQFTVYGLHDQLATLPYLLTPDITATLGHHFRQFDYEIFDDKLLVYASNIVVSRHQLDEMVRVGVWLAQHFDTTTHYTAE